MNDKVSHESKVTHTPGPWRVEPYPRVETDQVFSLTITSPTVPFVANILDTFTEDEAKANARLLAAAPELLACLRRMCGMYGAYDRLLAPLLAEDEGTIWTFERANSLALETIAKAVSK